MKNWTLFLFLICFTCSSIAQNDESRVTSLEVKSGKIFTQKGNLNTGKIIPLRFAANSSVACFPATQNGNFNGNHVLYSFDLPAYSKVTIKAASKGKDISLYGYQVGTTNYRLPEELSSCVTCEASYRKNKEEEIYFNAIKNDYRIVIGIAGVNQLKSGDFTIEIDLQTTRPIDESIKDDKKAALYTIKAENGKTLSYESNLSEGKQLPLAWAATSNMACFPATRNEEFRGNHMFFTVEIPKYSEMEFTITAKDKDKRINIYGIQGWDEKTLPPDIKSCVSCEAGYEKYVGTPDLSSSAGTHKISFTAINRPYKILIGVAGAKGTLDGDFVLTVGLKSR